MNPTLFIPGPTEVMPDMLQASAKRMIGHRFPEFVEIYSRINKNLHTLMETNGKGYIFLSTSSGSGVWEAGVRNLVNKKVLCIANGDFAIRWYDTAIANGKEATLLEFPWNTGADLEAIEKELATGEYDALTIVYNETSAGIQNPIEDLAKIMKKYPDVSFMVDAVSGMAGVPVKAEEWGVDLVLASVQKCFALSPGLAVFYVSDRAMEKAKNVKNRGYYFDFLIFKKYHEKNNTPSTPALPQIFQLDEQLIKILEKEGLQNRYKKHEEMQKIVREWAKKHFGVWVEDEKYASRTVTAIKAKEGFDFKALNSELRKRGKVVSGGYGKIKAETWRIGHMGDHSIEIVKELLSDIEDILNL